MPGQVEQRLAKSRKRTLITKYDSKRCKDKVEVVKREMIHENRNKPESLSSNHFDIGLRSGF